MVRVSIRPPFGTVLSGRAGSRPHAGVSTTVARRLRGLSHPFASATLAIMLHACQTVPGGTDQALTQGLQVAEAALAAERPDLASQLYRSLVERYPEAPAPRLRLARIAFELGDFRTARAEFVRAAGMKLPERSQAEAWYGAGRAALALEDGDDATDHFERARALVQDPADAAWITNGLAVAATMKADLEGAQTHYREAMALDPGNPRIMANYVRLQIELGRVEEAARLYTGKDRSFWSDHDEQRLRHLLRAHLHE